VVKASEREQVSLEGDEIVLYSHFPDDPEYNRKLFYNRFTPLINDLLDQH
jgi:hypothetical protein